MFFDAPDLLPGEIWLHCGGTGDFKSRFVNNLALNYVERKLNVALTSLERPALHTEKLIVDMHAAKHFHGDTYEARLDLVNNCGSLVVFDWSYLRLDRYSGLDLLVIDEISLIPTERNGDHILDVVRNIAVEYQIPVLATLQTARSVLGPVRENGWYSLADFPTRLLDLAGRVTTSRIETLGGGGRELHLQCLKDKKGLFTLRTSNVDWASGSIDLGLVLGDSCQQDSSKIDSSRSRFDIIESM